MGEACVGFRCPKCIGGSLLSGVKTGFGFWVVRCGEHGEQSAEFVANNGTVLGSMYLTEDILDRAEVENGECKLANDERDELGYALIDALREHGTAHHAGPLVHRITLGDVKVTYENIWHMLHMRRGNRQMSCRDIPTETEVRRIAVNFEAIRRIDGWCAWQMKEEVENG